MASLLDEGKVDEMVTLMVVMMVLRIRKVLTIDHMIVGYLVLMMACCLVLSLFLRMVLHNGGSLQFGNISSHVAYFIIHRFHVIRFRPPRFARPMYFPDDRPLN